MTSKEEVIQEIKNGIVDCMSLIDAENVEGCVSRMLSLCHKLEVNNLIDLTNKVADKFDVRLQKLNNIVAYIKMTLEYAVCADCEGLESTEGLDNYIDLIATVEELDEADRYYILTKITRDKHVTYSARQIVARGLFKSTEW